MTNTNPRDDMAKLSLHLRDCVQKADGNWAYVNIDVLLDAAEYLERFAQPEPEGPADEELWKFWDEVDGSIPTIFRAALSRWGRPAIEPVPVSERSPKAKDCNAQGNCWLTNDGMEPGWVLDNPEKCTNWTHWVPHWAMPVVTK